MCHSRINILLLVSNLDIRMLKSEKCYVNMHHFMQFALKLIRIRFRSTCTLVGYLIV